jgi:hypothetical protein
LLNFELRGCQFGALERSKYVEGSKVFHLQGGRAIVMIELQLEAAMVLAMFLPFPGFLEAMNRRRAKSVVTGLGSWAIL